MARDSYGAKLEISGPDNEINLFGTEEEIKFYLRTINMRFIKPLSYKIVRTVNGTMYRPVWPRDIAVVFITDTDELLSISEAIGRYSESVDSE